VLAHDQFHLNLFVSAEHLDVTTVHAHVLLQHDDYFAVLDFLVNQLTSSGGAACLDQKSCHQLGVLFCKF
jgi:hypothetical protein